MCIRDSGYVIEECIFGTSPESNFVVIAWLNMDVLSSH